MTTLCNMTTTSIDLQVVINIILPTVYLFVFSVPPTELTLSNRSKTVDSNDGQ